METEPTKRSHSAHRKRRERAHQLQLEKFKSDDDSAEDANGPNGVGKDKGRSRPRKKRTGAGTYEEDIIDGFAIVSFKTANDLEKFAAGKLSSKKNLSARQNNLMSPENRNRNNNREKRTPLPKIVKKPSNSLLNSEDSGENTDILDTTDLILNGPTRINNRRFSDVSTVSSSGAGYMCDSESGDEHISDASTDTFASPVNRSFNRDVIPGLQVSPSTTTVTTTVCMVTTTTSDITVTTVTTTTSCGTLASTTSTTPIITTTATPVVVNSNQHSYLPNNCHNHIANQHNSVNQQQLQPAGDKLQPVGDNHHKRENYSTAIQNSENYPLKRENFPAKSESFLTNHHKSDYLAGNLKSDNFATSQYQPAGQLQNLADSYQSSHTKKDNFTPNHFKSDNFHSSHNSRDSQPAVIHSYPAGVIHHKGENHPAGSHRNENYPVGNSKHDNFSTSHHKTEHVSTSHLKSEHSGDNKQQNPNTVSNHHHHYNSHHHNQYHHQQQQQQKQQQYQHHSSVSKDAPQTLHRSHSEAIIRHHEASRQPSPNSNSLKRVQSPANLKRGHPSGIPPTPPLTKSQPFVPKTQQSASVSSLPSSTVIREHKRTPPPPPAKTLRRDEPRERESHQVLPPSLTVSKSPFLGLQGHHGSTTPILYSPLGPSPGLQIPLHSTPSHSTLPGAPSISPLHPQPPTPNHNMFAPPMPLGPPAGPLGGATPGPPPPVIPDPDMLREELNRRFLASTQDRSVLQAMPGFLKADFHQHMHQHQHQHTHNHTYHGGLPGPPGAPSPVVPPPAAHMYDYRPGLPHRPRGHIAEPDPRHIANSKDKPVHPQHPASGLPGLSSHPSLLLNPAAATPGAGPLGTGLSGAFQPKNVSSLHPAHQLLMPMRDRDKPGPSPQPALTGAKKPGKWCAAHVRIAWEIYHHQQKTSDKGPGDNKMADPLRPPGHLLPGSMIQRGPDYPNSASTSGLGSGRGLFDASPHTLLGAPQLAPPSFPRPSPYSIGTSLTLGNLGNGLVSTSREPAISISSGSQEWNRLHRTPPTFPTPPAWAAKTEDREKELERERSIERRREEERERERRLSIDDRHRFQSLDERSRDRLRDNEILMKSRSRSRSRSPVRNGRVDSAKLTDRRYEENPLMKIKEERREREDLMSAERDRLLKNEISEREQMMKNEFLRTTNPFLQQASAMERTRMLMPGLLGVDRFQNPAAVWNPFDKGPLDFQNHRFGIPRDLEPNRNPLLTRFPHPETVTSMAMLEQERLKEELLLRDERAKREYLDGLPLFERERLFYEQHSKIPTLRPPENFVGMAHHFPRTISPAFGHPSMIKRSSPAVIPGAPPPLIHTVNAPHNRGLNPAMMNKNKGVSPIDSVGESKCDSNSNSTDPDAHSR